MSNQETAPPPSGEAWFYADLDYRRQGPVGREDVLALHRDGRLRRESLVWRQGMDKWRPLAEVFELPPPDMRAVAFGSGTPSPAAGKKKMGGCLIALLVAAGLMAISIPVIAILAAIAVPAYQNYVLRAKVATASAGLAGLRAHLAERQADDGHCPGNGEDDIPTANGFDLDGVTRVEVGPREDGDGTTPVCAITLTFGGTGHTRLDGTTLRWEYRQSGKDGPREWVCAGTANHQYLPRQCRD
ncbi:DUF4339 domain-containing protein [Lysobacter pythonis]|uniref:DUF4339 domain-containing protein n=1 Tax=Solilutibacter pythonis TaxID=2483112 RepID=A0A3M2HJ43_9GAMM|nr:pilin [Lysobacter pythonis]RMH88998.1 DUF4339 domain-containing protein [Lysobacter pythonis]